MFKKIMLVVCLGFLAFAGGCSKYIKPTDKAAYDNATNAVAMAEKEVASAESSESKNSMLDKFNTSKSHLAMAKENYNKDKWQDAINYAMKASAEAKEVRELPGTVSDLIKSTEKSLAFAREIGLDKTYGKKIKEINDFLFDARNHSRLQKYDLALSEARQADSEIRKAIDVVEKANNAMAQAKTALVEAKEAGADVSVADLYKSAEEALATAKTEMDNSNFEQSTEASGKAKALAGDAARKAKEMKAQ